MSNKLQVLLKTKYRSNLFTDIARELLTNNVLVINNSKYQIMEIEFYYYSKEHPDPYVHKAKEQLTNGGWYFHRIKSASKSFTLKGIDLTFGDKEQSYGGILIRAIKRGNRFIEGPSKTVDAILDENKCNNVLEMLGKDDYSNAFTYKKLYIKEQEVNANLFQSPRVGLKDGEYRDKLYRYHSNIKLAKKGVKEIERGKKIGIHITFEDDCYICEKEPSDGMYKQCSGCGIRVCYYNQCMKVQWFQCAVCGEYWCTSCEKELGSDITKCRDCENKSCSNECTYEGSSYPFRIKCYVCDKCETWTCGCLDKEHLC